MAVMQIAAAPNSYSEWDHDDQPQSIGFERTDIPLNLPDFVKETDPDWLETDPDWLIDLLTYGTNLRDLGVPIIRQIFERLFAACDSEQDRLASSLQRITDPDLIVRAALDQFREKGNAERLVLAAALLERYGDAALRPLQHLVDTNAPECEYFVDTLANLAGDPAYFESMEKLISSWSRHPARIVRLRLLEINEALPYALRILLLKRLCEDQDEEISEAAKEIAQSDECRSYIFS